MTEQIIIAGACGQGIMLLGKVLAEAAMRENKYVTWLPSYGAEVRGGAAYCMVIVSNLEIGSPYIEKADTLMAMNEPSLIKFKDRINPKGLLLINSSLIENQTLTQIKADKKSTYIRIQSARICVFPFTETAIKLGNVRVANMVALGCFVSQKNIVEAKSVLRVIQEIAPADKKDLIEINQDALREGMNFK